MICIKKKKFVGCITAAIILAFFVYIAYGLKNPAAVYCDAMGYEYIVEEIPEGQVGLCKLPDGSTCLGFDFLKGKCGEGYSYCRQKGYELKVVIGPEKCGPLAAPEEECAVCVLENGEEVEVTKLMNLSFKDLGVCGDGFCFLGEENYDNCRNDCPSGSRDLYCDGVKDSICDPDCPTEQDEDCGITKVSTTTTFKSIEEREERGGLKTPDITTTVLVVLFLTIALVILFKFRKRKE